MTTAFAQPLALLLACTRCWERPLIRAHEPLPRPGCCASVALQLAAWLVSERVPALDSWIVFRDARSQMPFTLRDLAVYRRGSPAAPRTAVLALIELLERSTRSGCAWLSVRLSLWRNSAGLAALRSTAVAVPVHQPGACLALPPASLGATRLIASCRLPHSLEPWRVHAHVFSQKASDSSQRHCMN